MKSGLHNVALFFHGKSRRKVRSDHYWTDIYPSPEPAIFYRAVNKSCDWVFVKIDRFFQGSKIQQNASINKTHSFKNECSSNCDLVWELNQDVADIAINDLKESLSWLLPGFVRKYANKLNQLLLLYFFTDMPVEDEVSNPVDPEGINTANVSGKSAKIIYVIRELKEDLSCKFLSIQDWWSRLFRKICLLLHGEPPKKTFYLLGDFIPKGYDYSVDNQNYIIKEPDKTKLNPAFSFHKRN